MRIKRSCTIRAMILLVAMLCVAPAISATKVSQQVCGRVYLKGGEVIETTDSSRIGTPAKKHGKLVIVENAFTHRAKESRLIEGTEVDSVQIWQRTRTDRVRTLVYEPDYGWCWQVENANGIRVCGFSPKGYFLAGNGGMSARGELIMLVVKDGRIYEFDKPGKMANDEFRRQVAAFVADNPALAQKILDSRLTRSGTLRLIGEKE